MKCPSYLKRLIYAQISFIFLQTLNKIPSCTIGYVSPSVLPSIALQKTRTDDTDGT